MRRSMTKIINKAKDRMRIIPRRHYTSSQNGINLWVQELPYSHEPARCCLPWLTFLIGIHWCKIGLDHLMNRSNMPWAPSCLGGWKRAFSLSSWLGEIDLRGLNISIIKAKSVGNLVSVLGWAPLFRALEVDASKQSPH